MKNKDLSRYFSFLFSILLLTDCNYTASGKMAAQQWKELEPTFESDTTYENPYIDVDFWVDFQWCQTGQDGEHQPHKIVKHPELAEGHLCLACPGYKFNIYLPEGDEVEVHEISAKGQYRWHDPKEGQFVIKRMTTSDVRAFKSSITGPSVLIISSSDRNQTDKT